MQLTASRLGDQRHFFPQASRPGISKEWENQARPLPPAPKPAAHGKFLLGRMKGSYLESPDSAAARAASFLNLAPLRCWGERVQSALSVGNSGGGGGCWKALAAGRGVRAAAAAVAAVAGARAAAAAAACAVRERQRGLGMVVSCRGRRPAAAEQQAARAAGGGARRSAALDKGSDGVQPRRERVAVEFALDLAVRLELEEAAVLLQKRPQRGIQCVHGTGERRIGCKMAR